MSTSTTVVKDRLMKPLDANGKEIKDPGYSSSTTTTYDNPLVESQLRKFYADEVGSLFKNHALAISNMSLYKIGKIPGFDKSKAILNAIDDIALSNFELAANEYLSLKNRANSGDQQSTAMLKEAFGDMINKGKSALSIRSSKLVLEHPSYFSSNAVESARSLINDQVGRYENSEDIYREGAAIQALMAGQGVNTEAEYTRLSGLTPKSTSTTSGSTQQGYLDVKLLENVASNVAAAKELADDYRKRGDSKRADEILKQAYDTVDTVLKQQDSQIKELFMED